MGNNCCQESKINRQRLALLLVGLDNAGKTVTAKGLAGEPIDCPVPTIGFSVIELKHQQYDVKIFDLGGGSNIRGIWYKYFVDVHGVIFVVDSCDSDRFYEVREVLEEILSSDKITGKPLLILANKQDQESALDEIDIIEYLRIEELVNRYKCPTLVQSCCANEMNSTKTDLGIRQGYEWLINYIDKNYDKLNVRVQMDMVEQEIKDKQEMLQRLERIKAERARAFEDPDAIETFSEYASKMGNGQIVKDIDDLELPDFYPNPEEPIQASSSSSSTTFPEVYFVNDYTTEKERPKSALQLVKRHLQLDLRRSQSAKNRRNKTAPIQKPAFKEFIPVPICVSSRFAKSASSKVFTVMGPGGDFYGPRMEMSDIEKRFQINRSAPLRVKSRAQVNREEETNGICVVDVEQEL